MIEEFLNEAEFAERGGQREAKTVGRSLNPRTTQICASQFVSHETDPASRGETKQTTPLFSTRAVVPEIGSKVCQPEAVNTNVDTFVTRLYTDTMSQVRVSENTHELLRSLSSAEGRSMQDIIDKAVEDYRRKSFLEGLSNDFRVLRSDADAWKEHEEESALWDAALLDGIENE